MKQRPIIFNEYQVRALLDGSMTQTRRIMKVQPSEHFTPMNMALETDYEAHWYTPGIVDKHGYLQPSKHDVFGVASEDEGYTCPFGAVGDCIWVRETWNKYGGLVTYRADYDWIEDMKKEMACHASYPKWHPSIHMPRWASRILLEITDVRVERLNDISQEDAQAEGMELTGWRPTYSDPDSGGEVWTPYDNFALLWESIYGEESWQSNPWVWVIEFKRIEAGDD